MSVSCTFYTLPPYYAPDYAFGGVPRVVQGMAEGAVKRGHTVTVLTSHLPTHAETIHTVDETSLNGVHVIRVPHAFPALRGRFNLSTSFGISSPLRRVLPQVDLIHTHRVSHGGKHLAIERAPPMPQARCAFATRNARVRNRA
ncbi:MAG UNVERIFIED_CONTAM: glycosyltransferase [Anaerolineae bacterium]